jgi:uncharacterized membrane protein YqhA
VRSEDLERDTEGRADGAGFENAHGPLFVLYIGTARAGVMAGISAMILGSLALFLYGAVAIVHEFWLTIREDIPDMEGAKHLSVVAVEVADLFLLATVLNIVAIGLFQLFIRPDLSPQLPSWLQIRNLDQLKSKLVGVIAVVLGVSYMASVVEGSRDRNVLYLGFSIAAVIVALGLLSGVLERSESKDK